MKKRYILGFVLGIVTYVILHLFFNIYEAFAITMALVIGYSVLIFLKTYKFKVMLKNLNQFVDITDQSIEKIILDEYSTHSEPLCPPLRATCSIV